jgi:hypothetical protein
VRGLTTAELTIVLARGPVSVLDDFAWVSGTSTAELLNGAEPEATEGNVWQLLGRRLQQD